MKELSIIEKKRYTRHFSLREIGLQGQQKIKQSKILCVGAGGLGSTVLYHLAAAGVGTLGIIDNDVVELSNLQRQILYTTEDVGLLKVEIAKKRLLSLNPHLQISIYPMSLTQKNIFCLFSDYDLIVDATDNYATRYLISDLCCILNKPDVFASISRFQGQCSVFGLVNAPCYRCLYPEPPPTHLIPNCSEAGVLGVLPGILGCLQANEVLKWILGIGELLLGRVLHFDALKTQWTEYKLEKNPQCPICNNSVTLSTFKKLHSIQAPEMTVSELKQQQDFLLLDVREFEEYAQGHMNGLLIPLSQLPSRIQELNKEQLIIVHCQSGQRSQQAATLLIDEGFQQVYSLAGGISAWFEAQDE